jgi:prepilin-type N-terminal cleavage/methylation domain-containing protein
MLKSNGFTLIELSIVLVIVGLLTGGVLAGKELIHSAEIGAQIRQIDSYQLALDAFKLKYNCTPGDCDKATAFWSTAINGNGNGNIETELGIGYDVAPPARWENSNEYQQFFIQLGLANLIAGSFDGSPALDKGLPSVPLNRQAGFFAGDTQNFYGAHQPNISSYRKGNNGLWLVACAVNPGATLNVWDDAPCSVFVPFDLKRVDIKIDDGLPLSGKLFGFTNGGNANQCVNVLLTDYNIPETRISCHSAWILD